jgi:putative transcriptional regulator
MTVSNSVQKRRFDADLTQEILAQKAGVTRQTIIAIEKGNYTPSVTLALRLAKVFNCAVEDLFSLK